MTVDLNEASVDEICRAQALLVDVVRRFESRFVEIVEFDPHCGDASRNSYGQKFTTYAGGVEFPEYCNIPQGVCCKSPSAAVFIFGRNTAAMSVSDRAALYWRKRPEILPCDDDLWFVRCRMTVMDRHRGEQRENPYDSL